MKRFMFALSVLALCGAEAAGAQETYYFRDAPSAEQYSAILFGADPANADAKPRLRTRGVRGIQFKDAASDPGALEASTPPAKPDLIAAAETGSAEPASAGNRIAIPIQFALNSDAISPAFRSHLDNLAVSLSTRTVVGRSLVITGHTDASGPDNYNVSLSARRANAVRAYLISKGVSPSRLHTRAEGEGRPLSGLSPEDSRNRRVEFMAS